MEIISNKQNADKAIPPRKSDLINLLIKTNPEHEVAKKYAEELKKYEEQTEKIKADAKVKQPEVEIPPLDLMDPESLYFVFKEGFKAIHGKEFDESANDFESRKFAKTICAYFAKRKSFLKSPLLNQKSIPSLEKGLMIIGSYGTGKTAVMETFDKIFKFAFSNPIFVHDRTAAWHPLARYALNFGYFTANSVVKTFERLSDGDEKEAFWKTHRQGRKYYDDIMTEKTGSNYGKLEVFKDIFEERYATKCTTFVSLNYSGHTFESTMEAIADKYGERVYDRIFEMFNVIELRGESLRK